MSLLKSGPKRKSDKNVRQLGLLVAVPTILFVGPMIGFFAGRWADDKLGTDPYLLVAGIVLGFGAAGIEIFNLLKKASAIDKEKEDEKRS